MSNTSTTHDCGHLCCDRRSDAFHDHFLRSNECPKCKAQIGEVAPPPVCPNGCGCVWLEDADRADCACDGPCCTEEWDKLADGSPRPDATDVFCAWCGEPGDLVAFGEGGNAHQSCLPFLHPISGVRGVASGALLADPRNREIAGIPGMTAVLDIGS